MNRTAHHARGQRILSWLHIRRNEMHLVGIVNVYAFFIGVVQNLIIAVPLALFLAHYSSSTLPYAYIAVSLVTILIGMLFSYFERRTHLTQLHAWVLVTAAATLLLLWLAITTMALVWLVIVLFVWCAVISGFCNLMINTLLNQLFTLQQGKRIYGLIAAGQALGGTVSGLSLPFLVAWINTSNVILMIAASLLVLLYLQMRIKRSYWFRLTKGMMHVADINAHEKKAPITFKKIWGKKYIPSVYLLVALSMFAYITLDMLFNTLAQQHFVEADKLAGFFGLFFAATYVLNVIVGLVLLNWSFNRLGVIGTLASNPLIIGLTVGFAWLVSLVPSSEALLFIVIAAARLMHETLITTVNEQSVLLLWQPLRPDIRAWAIAKNETIVIPVAIGLIGVVLLVADFYNGGSLGHFFYLILVLCVLILMLLAVMRTYYLKALLNALSKHVEIDPGFHRLDKDSLTVIRYCLKSSYAVEVIYILDTLEKVKRSEFMDSVVFSLRHPSPEVRLYALNKIETYKIYSAQKIVSALREERDNPALFKQVLITSAAIGGHHILSLLEKDLFSDDLLLRTATVIALIKHGTKTGREHALASVLRMAASANPAERRIAAEAAQYVPLATCGETLYPLLQDDDCNVRELMCMAVATANNPAIYPALINNLVVSGVKEAAFSSLLAQGKQTVHYLTEHFDEYPKATQQELIKLLSYSTSPGAVDMLLLYVKHQGRQLNRDALRALARKKCTLKGAQIKSIRTLADKEVEYLTLLRNKLRYIVKTEQNQLLYDLLQREIQLAEESLFDFLSLLYPADIIFNAKQGFQTKDEDMSSYAIEILTQLLSVKDQTRFLRTLMHDAEPKEISSSDSEQSWQAIKALIDLEVDFYIDGIKAAMIYTIKVAEYESFYPYIKKIHALNPDDHLVEETWRWANAALHLEHDVE